MFGKTLEVGRTTSETEKYSYLESFIEIGLDLTKLGLYGIANKYFRSQKMAADLDIEWIDFIVLDVTDAIEDKDIKSYIQYSYFNCPIKIGLRPQIGLTKVAIKPDFYTATPLSVQKRLFHNLALCCAEEWLHALRYLNKGKPIAGHDSDEVDVINFILQREVPVTELFLGRYPGRNVLAQK